MILAVAKFRQQTGGVTKLVSCDGRAMSSHEPVVATTMCRDPRRGLGRDGTPGRHFTTNPDFENAVGTCLRDYFRQRPVTGR